MEGLVGYGTRKLFLNPRVGNFLSTWNAKAFIPALIKRLYYCSDQDAAEINMILKMLPSTEENHQMQFIPNLALNLQRSLFPSHNFLFSNSVPLSAASPFPPDVYMSAVGFHIIISELMTEKKVANITEFANYLSHGDDTLAFSMNQKFGPVIIDWPTYKLDEYYNNFGVTKKPYLVIHGELDPQTSYAFFMQASRKFGSNGIQVSVPYGPHHTSDEVMFTAVGASCSLGMITSFVATGGVGDTSCLQDIPPPDFEGVTPQMQAISNYFFGTPHVWGDDKNLNYEL